MKIKANLWVILALSILPTFARAADLIRVSAVPSAWILQEYTSVQIALWNTGTSCSSGQALLPTTATDDTKKRLWATVLAAKTSGHKFFFYYSLQSASCIIDSFGMDAE